MSTQKIKSDIKEFKWSVIKVLADETGPAFAYSIGLTESFHHPEIILIGMDLDTMHTIINNCGYEIKNGLAYKSGVLYSGILDDYKCAMLSVDKKYYGEYLGQAIEYYKSKSFPTLQCIYPTTSGVYPWQKEWPKEFDVRQPVLGNIQELKNE